MTPTSQPLKFTIKPGRPPGSKTHSKPTSKYTPIVNALKKMPATKHLAIPVGNGDKPERARVRVYQALWHHRKVFGKHRPMVCLSPDNTEILVAKT